MTGEKEEWGSNGLDGNPSPIERAREIVKFVTKNLAYSASIANFIRENEPMTAFCAKCSEEIAEDQVILVDDVTYWTEHAQSTTLYEHARWMKGS